MCIYKPNKLIYFLIQAYCPKISMMTSFLLLEDKPPKVKNNQLIPTECQCGT